MTMIDDEEGMNNALNYYTNGESDSYWKRFVNNIDDRLERWTEEKTHDEMNHYWGDWTDEDPYPTNVDSDEEEDEEQNYDEWEGLISEEQEDDDYYDYDDEWEGFDYDDYETYDN